MAEESFQEKTEDATPRRLQEARKEGNVAKSAEFNSVFILLFGLITLSFLGSQIFQQLISGFKIFYREIANMEITYGSIHYYFKLGFKSFFKLIAPLLGVLALVGIGVNLVQVGFLFTLKPLVPNFKKLNPLTGFKKFVSPKSFVELVKGILKLLIVGLIAYWTIMSQKERYLYLIYADVGEIVLFIASIVFQVAIRTIGALVVLALLDLFYQKWQYKKDMRMTKEQVKEEQKQAEGDPLVKSQIKSLQQSRSRERMMGAVAEADVVITNPARLAVALKYDLEEMTAPMILAKGARRLAKRIREIAQEHDIPIVENKPLAQSLYKIGEVGKEIPYDLFHAVAEVFAYVFQMKKRN
ncbi:flagellar biosynthesis protein FlhB [candidate division KSB1 bacterium]|nr:flagellar biosynthesis protein FlhB [candidate division KSB1 bacterium]